MAIPASGLKSLVKRYHFIVPEEIGKNLRIFSHSARLGFSYGLIMTNQSISFTNTVGVAKRIICEYVTIVRRSSI